MEGSKRKKLKQTTDSSQIENEQLSVSPTKGGAERTQLPQLDDEAKKTLVELFTLLDAIDKRAKGIRT
jgi:hypothetical protein